MVKHYVVILATLALVACSDPLQIRFGSTPSEDLQKNSDKLKKLPPDDLAVLTLYVNFAEKQALAGKQSLVVGKTVSEVLGDAKSWQKVQVAAQVAERERQEAARLEAGKLEAERKLLQDRVARSVTISFIGRTFLPPNPLANRPESVIKLEYEIQNLSAKAITALKGKGVFRDLFGKTIVEHPLQTDKTIPLEGRIRFSVNYRISPIWREMSTLAQTEDGKFTFAFAPEILVFEGGETLSLAERPAPVNPETQPPEMPAGSGTATPGEPPAGGTVPPPAPGVPTMPGLQQPAAQGTGS